MKPIQAFLNKIKWDKKENPEDYKIYYLDFKKLTELNYTKIKRLDEGFFVIERNGQETFIPLHRIKKVTRKGEVVWQRS
ncbi:DUF504 domain-containing protein [Candidatus Woesearchaeota archaeon]|nr:DUF504 domain-containing protein [Candidatus Woesearchaeota archaeon]